MLNSTHEFSTCKGERHPANSPEGEYEKLWEPDLTLHLSRRLTHRVDEDEGSQVSVRDSMSLEPDRHHISVVGLKAKRSGHLDVSAGKTRPPQNSAKDLNNPVPCLYGCMKIKSNTYGLLGRCDITKLINSNRASLPQFD